MTGFVYFLRCGDFVKIGFSANPKVRLSHLKTVIPFDYKLLGVHPGSRQHEQQLHRIFSSLRHRGEWFRIDDEILKIAETGLPHMDLKSEPMKAPPRDISFNIFGKLDGENSCLDIITELHGKRPSRDLVGKWKSNRRIPASKGISLVEECRRRGIKASYFEDCVSMDK